MIFIKNNKGFTLVELLVVISIIGILAIIAVPALFRNIEKAKAVDLLADINAIKSASLSYYAEKSDAPNNGNTFDSGELLPELDGTPSECFKTLGLETLSNPFNADSYKLMGNLSSGVELEIMFPTTISKNILDKLDAASLEYRLLSVWAENDILVVNLLSNKSIK